MLLPDSITLAVYRFNQFVAETLFALIKLAPVNEPPVPIIIVLAIIFPAEILPVYVVKNAPTLALT